MSMCPSTEGVIDIISRMCTLFSARLLVEFLTGLAGWVPFCLYLSICLFIRLFSNVRINTRISL